MESLKKVEDVAYNMYKTAEALMYKIWALRELRDVADEKELTELLKRVLDMYIRELETLSKRLG